MPVATLSAVAAHGVLPDVYHACPSRSSQLNQLGWTKAAELAKVARAGARALQSANWLHKARQMPQQEFKGEVDKYLTRASEPSELIYFKLYRSQLPVIERTLEIASRMLGARLTNA